MNAEAAAGIKPASDFETLLADVLEQAYGTAMRLTGNPADAEDLVQDAALLAHRGFGSFTTGSNFRAWFYRILLNRFYSNYRRQRRAGVAVELEDTPELYLYEQAEAAGLKPSEDTAAALLDRLDAESVEQALAALPDDFRAAATLYFMQDLPYQEIAEILNVPIGTVRSRLHRARRMLRKALWTVAQERGIVGPAALEE
ncbi:MAG TPA: sigma-70 family RNA polymerase sigma factor [Gemmatimonadales bacterium]|jgi:RNA polymerase sigma-70 factor (ECF subfamily)